MSSMDIDPPDEKENIPAMPSLEAGISTGPVTEMKDSKSDSTKEQVSEIQEDEPSLPPKTDKSCDECQEKEVKCTHLEQVKIFPRKEHVPNSDDSSDLSDAPSPMLSRAPISEMKMRNRAGHAAEKRDAMDIDAAEPPDQEPLHFPSNPVENEEDNALSSSRTHSRSPPSSSSVKISLDKEEAAVESPKADANKGPDNDEDSISPSSPGALLLTPGTGAGSLSNRALSPVTTVEAEPKLTKLEPEPVVELSAEEKEALATLNVMLSTVSPAVARAAVKDHASKCLVGSNTDETSFVEAIFSQTSEHVVRRFIESYSTRILDVANQHCKPFLDRALEIRVQDIDGKKLAGYLARANRLGFEEQDDIDGESALPIERNVQVISSDPSDNDGDHRTQLMHPTNGEMHGNWSQPPPGYMYNPAYPRPDFAHNAHTQSGLKVCHKCGAAFKQNAGLRYHLEKDVCKKAGVPQGPVMARCESCGKEFRSPGGYHYHMTNNVCGALLGRNSVTPPPDSQVQKDHGAGPAGQQPQTKEEEVAATAAPSGASHTPVLATLPHMFQNAQQMPYQGPYQNPPPQHHAQHPPPMPERILPSMNGTPQPTAASGEQIVNTNGLLTPAQAQKLNEDLRAEDRKYAQQLENIDPSLTGAALDAEVKRLKAGMSTRKSNLRRKHGIFVRKTDKTAANAVRNEDGSIDLAPAGKTISVGSGFAPVNRPEATVASPAPHSASRGPESPPPGVPDPKRRRVSERPSSMVPSPYSQGPMGYPPNYNMHPGSYDPRQQQMMPGPYQQYSMSPYTQQSPYQQQQPMHPPYGHPQPAYQMNTIIPAPGARPSAQSPNMPPMQGTPGPGYFPPSGFVSVNQPPPPTPPPGYMLVASPAPQQHYPPINGQPHNHPPIASTSASPRASSAGAVENGKSRPKVPTDNAEKVWKAKQRDWVVQTGPQHAFKRMEKDGGVHSSKSASPEGQDSDANKGKIMKKKEREKNEFIIPISDDDEATDEDEYARRPSKATSEKNNTKDKERKRREMSTSSELSELDDSALLGPGNGGEPHFASRASEEESVPKASKKPVERKKQQPQAKTQLPRASGFNAVNAVSQHDEERGYDSNETSNARPPPKKQPVSHAGPPPSNPRQTDGGNDDDLEPGHEILQVASDDEMVVDTPPPRRRQAAATTSSSAPPPASSSSAGTPGFATAPDQPKKRLGRPVGWKKGMGGYRELLDAGVVHHNAEGTPNSRRRAEKRAAERLRRQTEGGEGAESLSAGGAKASGGRKSVG